MDSDSEMNTKVLEEINLAVKKEFDCGNFALRPLDDNSFSAKIVCYRAEIFTIIFNLIVIH